MTETPQINLRHMNREGCASHVVLQSKKPSYVLLCELLERRDLRMDDPMFVSGVEIQHPTLKYWARVGDPLISTKELMEILKPAQRTRSTASERLLQLLNRNASALRRPRAAAA